MYGVLVCVCLCVCLCVMYMCTCECECVSVIGYLFIYLSQNLDNCCVFSMISLELSKY